MKALELALAEVRSEPKKKKDSERPELFMSERDLEIALADMDNAKTPAEKAKAFKAALSLAKAQE